MIVNDIKLAGRVVLAPLAGISDSSFRSICRRLGAAMVFTEMISADGLIQKNARTLDYLYFRAAERPIGFQLFGSDPAVMAQAVELIEPYQPDFIDLNFGCPVKKVIKRGAGAALLKDLDRLESITRAVVKHASRPVLAKIRKGWDLNNNNALEVAQRLEQCGVAAITVHPRTQAQGYGGQADWQTIKAIKRKVSILVIGSGDVRCAEDAQRMIDETGCDLVMIGRGALGNPWIFQQATALLENGQTLSPPALSERLEVMLQHLEDCARVRGELVAVFEMRKHLGWYTHGLPGSSQMRANLFRLKSIASIKELLQDYFRQLLDLHPPIKNPG